MLQNTFMSWNISEMIIMDNVNAHINKNLYNIHLNKVNYD